MGWTTRHGPHHGAQKSTSTGCPASSTSDWNVPSVTSGSFPVTFYLLIDRRSCCSSAASSPPITIQNIVPASMRAAGAVAGRESICRSPRGGRMSAPPQPPRGHTPCRLEDDPAGHLRRPYPAVAEDNRDLGDTKPGLDRAEGRLDLEGVALRGERFQVDRLEDLAPEALEPAGEIVDLDAERGARVRAAPAADRPAARPPICHPATVDISRAHHDIGVLRGLEQARQVVWVVREVGVH